MSKKFLNALGNINRIMAISLILIFGLAGVSMAQEQQQQQQQQPYTPPEQQYSPAPTNFTDDELQKAGKAYVGIMEIREEIQQELTDATDPNEAQKIQMEANEEILKEIEKHDLEVDRYNEIISEAQRNEEVRTELLEIINQIQQ
jgi:uncharacterized protein HemX